MSEITLLGNPSGSYLIERYYPSSITEQVSSLVLGWLYTPGFIWFSKDHAVPYGPYWHSSETIEGMLSYIWRGYSEAEEEKPSLELGAAPATLLGNPSGSYEIVRYATSDIVNYIARIVADRIYPMGTHIVSQLQGNVPVGIFGWGAVTQWNYYPPWGKLIVWGRNSGEEENNDIELGAVPPVLCFNNPGTYEIRRISISTIANDIASVIANRHYPIGSIHGGSGISGFGWTGQYEIPQGGMLYRRTS